MNLLGLFSLNPTDLFIILVLALLFFGAKRLPELARSLGTAMNEFNKAKEDVHRQIAQAAEPPSPSQPASPAQPTDSAHQQPGTSSDSQPKA